MKVFWITGLLCLTQLHIVESKKGKFITIDFLTNKIRLNPLKTIVPTDIDFCEDSCTMDPVCDNYSYNSYSLECQLYDTSKSPSKLEVSNGYKLFVLQKSEDDGFLFYDNRHYIKPFLKKSHTFKDAQKECEKYNGNILAVKDKKMNDYVKHILETTVIFGAWISLTDEGHEGKWTYGDGAKAVYENWYYKGKTTDVNKNCAFMLIDGHWMQDKCENNQFFFCNIPIY